jgi:hypothetical protein
MALSRRSIAKSTYVCKSPTSLPFAGTTLLPFHALPPVPIFHPWNDSLPTNHSPKLPASNFCKRQEPSEPLSHPLIRISRVNSKVWQVIIAVDGNRKLEPGVHGDKKEERIVVAWWWEGTSRESAWRKARNCSQDVWPKRIRKRRLKPMASLSKLLFLKRISKLMSQMRLLRLSGKFRWLKAYNLTKINSTTIPSHPNAEKAITNASDLIRQAMLKLSHW